MAKDNIEQKQHLIDLMNMENKENIIDKWLKENGNPEIEKQVENEYKEIMKETAVEWLVDCLNNYDSKMIELFNYEIERAKEMEKQEKLINQLFIGKVVDVLGFDKTTELLKECKGAFKK
jgi:predicted TIM-barrel fold metal-dependent hydrolase